MGVIYLCICFNYLLFYEGTPGTFKTIMCLWVNQKVIIKKLVYIYTEMNSKLFNILLLAFTENVGYSYFGKCFYMQL